MTAKHTPGPFWLKQFDDRQYLIMAGDPDNKMTWRTIATILIDGKESQANADLLRAAPELLTTLEAITDQAGRAALVQDRSVGIIKATCAIISKDAKIAIRKARGTRMTFLGKLTKLDKPDNNIMAFRFDKRPDICCRQSCNRKARINIDGLKLCGVDSILYRHKAGWLIPLLSGRVKLNDLV